MVDQLPGLQVLPPCRPNSASATALFLDLIPGGGGRRTLRTEKVLIRDGKWVVRRDGRLVPLATIFPPPAGLEMRDGSVEGGGGTRWWASRDDFLRDNGIDPADVYGA